MFQKPYDSYYGSKIQLKYIIRCTIIKTGFNAKSIEKEVDVGVLTTKEIEVTGKDAIKMEVGIEDMLNIKINVDKKYFTLKDIL